MPTRCNRSFYCSSYCLLNMFRATTMPIIRSSRVLYSGYVSGLQDASILQTGHITLSSTPGQQLENHRQQPLYNTLELLMMGIVVPETC